MTSTLTQRDPEKARAALRREFSEYESVGSRPVKAANTVLAAWGIPALAETGEFQGLLRQERSARYDLDEFISFVDSYVETKEIEADPGLLAAIAEAEAERDKPAPEPLTGERIIAALDEALAAPPVEEQLRLPGIDWDQYEVKADVDDSVGNGISRLLLEKEGIVVLRKVSKGKVKGGYSLSKPALIDAILATDLTSEDIQTRIADAK